MAEKVLESPVEKSWRGPKVGDWDRKKKLGIPVEKKLARRKLKIPAFILDFVLYHA